MARKWPASAAPATSIGGRDGSLLDYSWSVETSLVRTRLGVFPDVRAVSEGKAAFWSSSRHEALPMLTYTVDFIAPAVDANTAGVSMGVRLVRSGRFPEQVTPRPD